MSDQPSTENTSDALSHEQKPSPEHKLSQEQQVAEYLRQNLDFFTRHQTLLQELQLPHQHTGTVSLVERQTALLRQKTRNLQSQLDQLIDAARHNDLQFDKVRRLVINTLESHNLDEAIIAVEESLCQDFNGDAVKLVLFGDEKTLKANNLKVISKQEAEEKLANLIGSDWAICGSLTDQERELLFGDQASKILSAAAVPLIKGNTIGILAIGSHEANYFHSSMGTLFLNYLGEVLSRVFFNLAGFTDKNP